MQRAAPPASHVTLYAPCGRAAMPPDEGCPPTRVCCGMHRLEPTFSMNPAGGISSQRGGLASLWHGSLVHRPPPWAEHRPVLHALSNSGRVGAGSRVPTGSAACPAPGTWRQSLRQRSRRPRLCTRSTVHGGEAPEELSSAAEATPPAHLQPPPQQQAEQPPPTQPLPQQQQQPTAVQPSRNKSTLRLLFTLLAVTVTAVTNRVLYKMALVPLSRYVFWLAQLQTCGYLLVYFLVLFLRYRAGVVSKPMLSFPARMPGMFMAIGFVEALSSVLGFLGAANLPGVVLPLLAQTILLWQVLLASTVLKKRLSKAQMLGVSLVMCGVCLAAWPKAGTSLHLEPFWTAVYTFSMLFPALDTIFKEKVFRQARGELKQDLDLFVMNSMGSLAQCVFVFMLLPSMIAMRGMALGDLPGYIHDGWLCFRGLTPSCGSDCAGAPLLPLAYVIVNLLFNVSALELIRSAGNVAMSLTMSAIVPVTILAFTLPLPFLPAPPSLGPTFLAGTAVLFAGLMIFNIPLWLPALTRHAKAWLAEEPPQPPPEAAAAVPTPVGAK